MVAFLVALADANVPVQADGVPPALLKKLQPGKISGFLCLGNVGPCVAKVLKRIQAEMRLVGGDSEDEAHLPATQVCRLSFTSTLHDLRMPRHPYAATSSSRVLVVLQ